MKTIFKLGVAVLSLGFAVHAQVTQAELQTIKMWPSGQVTWLASKIFNYAGDYGYYQDQTPMTADVGGPLEMKKWRWVYYGGLTGKRVIAYGTWGRPTIGPPVLRPDGRMGDNCGHAHMSYGVWMQYGYYSGGTYYTGWVGPWGGSKSGTRVNNNYCKFSTTADLGHIDPRFGWGMEQFDFTFPKTGNIWLNMVVGAVAASHGSFGCTSSNGGCVNQPYIVAYSLAY